MTLAIVAALLVSDPGSAIAADRVETLRASLTEAEEKWQGAIPSSYSFRLISGGPFGYATYQITVDGGECKAKSRYTFGKKVSRWKRATCEDHSINAIFTELRRQLSFPQERIELTFDADYGYPTKASFEPHSEIEDQSEYFEISSFKVRR